MKQGPEYTIHEFWRKLTKGSILKILIFVNIWISLYLLKYSERNSEFDIQKKLLPKHIFLTKKIWGLLRKSQKRMNFLVLVKSAGCTVVDPRSRTASLTNQWISTTSSLSSTSATSKFIFNLIKIVEDSDWSANFQCKMYFQKTGSKGKIGELHLLLPIQ